MHSDQGCVWLDKTEGFTSKIYAEGGGGCGELKGNHFRNVNVIALKNIRIQRGTNGMVQLLLIKSFLKSFYQSFFWKMSNFHLKFGQTWLSWIIFFQKEKSFKLDITIRDLYQEKLSNWLNHINDWTYERFSAANIKG